ncbi:hypothetical protein CkaCkLH20_04335 [Colletotrichum karsti]|uniref:Nephrocystin 3-like N-terminal domain-containing protein n=1 Tax=Colletotrichum karsti TaxID=1095194 RepID=A0A9P6LN93_9PEZI|nr:uncharacterized protein CkaCkLH20_04335 [Colletotrichum karsti]KAF9878297.1 hypothetical protein CkaCkLH20_04335 [Colletotrichum karsti]
MEAVGFASALLAILEASGKIVLACYEYRQALKSATDDIARLLAEAISIRNVTERLIEIAGAETGVNLPTLQIMCKPGGLLDSFVSELEDLSRLLEPHRKRTVMLVLKWPLTKSECEKSLSAMGRIKSTLQLALGADTAGNINAVLEHTRSLPKIGFGVSRLVEQTNEAKQDKALEDVLRLIRGRDQEQKYQEQAKRRANRTGEWLLSNESYIEWKARPCQLMWLHGMSGCGKTVLCSKVIQDLKYHCQVIESSSLCYYFFDGSDSSTVSLEKIHRSLISQLVCQIQASDNELDLDDLKWDLESLNAGPKMRRGPIVTVTELLEAILVKLMSQFWSTYVVIDGFDECEDADALENILRSLRRLQQKKKLSLLINANVDVNASGGRYGSAIGAAAAQGHADVVCELLEAGAEAQLRGRRFGDHRHNTLFLAVEGGSLEIVRLLLAHGATDYWVMKARPASALDFATQHGRIDIVKELLKHTDSLKGNSMESLAASQYSAAELGHKEIFRELAVHDMSIGGKLRHAAKAGDLTLVLECLDNGAEIDEPEDIFDHPRALVSAASSANVAIVRELLSRGADPNPDALEAAANAGSLEIVHELVKAGADVNPKWSGPVHEAARGKQWEILAYLAGQGADLHLALHRATVEGDLQAFEQLVKLGADINREKPDDKAPLLQAAARAAKAGSEEACFDLIERGASITSSYPVTLGTPLVYAIWEGLTEVIHALLGLGANPSQHGTIISRDKPSTPLLLAVEKRDIDTVHRLIAAGADVDEQDIEGFCPLHVAAVAASDEDATADIKGDAQILETLITKYHASINSPRLLNGSLPLHSAASRGSISQVRILIDAGAEIDATNNDGRTPLHWAAENGRWDVVELLLDRKANHELRSSEETLQMAWQLGHAAKEQPLWQIRPIKGWDAERIDALLERLEGATKDQRDTH